MIQQMLNHRKTDWEKILANVNDKGLVSEIYEQLMKLNCKKKKKKERKKEKKWTEYLNRHF